MNNFDPKKHQRQSIRLKDFDYSQKGAYFVTMVTQNRQLLFGNVENREMKINDGGDMVVKWWLELPNKFPEVDLGSMVVMPNHFHGIIFLIETGNSVEADLRVCPNFARMGADTGAPLRISPDFVKTGAHTGAPLRISPDFARTGADTGSPLRISLAGIVQWFKTMTTNEYIRGVKKAGWVPFHGKLWQRNYYEHIIRNELDLKSIWDYIDANPVNWGEDDENPAFSERRFGGK